ncbi:MAG: glycosyltransferase family 1 protein [Bacteroidaceae bacterium]|nr:glycosyltransferase family 1 protein [Bacteroidaceae bacterium]
MKILLFGEYSNVHWTLAEGLRRLGHKVTVVSDGDVWKDYPRDIDLRRRSFGVLDTLRYAADIARVLPKLKGYDVVQLINPIFLDLRASRIWPFYQRLRQQNGLMVMGAFGMDHYWVLTGLDCKTFRYSDFNMGASPRISEENSRYISEWLHGEKGKLNKQVAQDCDGIVAGLYEYERCYAPHFGEKLQYIPFPVQTETGLNPSETIPERMSFFIGIQQTRNEYKGTDVMLRALRRLAKAYPGKISITKAENVPFAEYKTMLDDCDILLDQLYSYTPAMNGLLAMSRGLVLVGGGEEEMYELLGERELRPIVNVLPDEEDVYRKLEQLVLHPEMIPELKKQSVEFVRRHHDYVKVARQYESFYNRLLEARKEGLA